MLMKRIITISCLTLLAVWVLISFLPNPGSSQGARDSAPVFGFLRDVVIVAQPQGVKVELTGDALAADFRSFTLGQPPRLVIDFPGVLSSFPKKFLEVGHPLLKDVRLGQHPDKLRLVLTFPATDLPPHRIAREADGVTIIVGKIEKDPEEGKKPGMEERRETGATQMPGGKTPAEGGEKPSSLSGRCPGERPRG